MEGHFSVGIVHNLVVILFTLVAGDVFLGITGLKKMITEIQPLIGAFLPHIAATLAIYSLFFWCVAIRNRVNRWEKGKGYEIISDMESLRKSIDYNERSIRRKNVDDPAEIYRWRIIVEKYQRFFPKPFNPSFTSHRAARFSELIKLYGYRKGIKKIKDGLDNKTKVS